VSTENRLRIAVFIDFDNIEIGVKSTLNSSFDAGLVLEALKERGEVVSKTAYSDWQRAGGYSRVLTQHAIRMVQRNMTPGGDKNGADINLALDALEMAFTHPHINAFVIVGGDSDFISLVEKLKQYDKKVFIVGGRAFTSQILQRNCYEFIAYEHLLGVAGTNGAATGRRPGRDGRDSRGGADIEQAIPLVTRALKVLSERDVTPQLGLLKSTLLQLDSTFSERAYGASTFRDFAQKLERAGVLRVQQVKGGWIVASADGAPGEAAAPAGDLPPADDNVTAASDLGSPRSDVRSGAAPDVIGTAADGVRELKAMLSSGVVRKWPLYLRNVKQIIRQVNPAFDERAYGFGSLVDLLRAAHKDGLVRVDRDRQGVVRVFQGSALDAATGRPESGAGAPDAMEIVVPDAIVEAAVEMQANALDIELPRPGDEPVDEPIEEPLEPPDDQRSVLGPKLFHDPESLKAGTSPARRGGRRPRAAAGASPAPRTVAPSGAKRPRRRRAS
jgi:uncharacterized LabA/DUF88 family protein